MFVVCLLGWSLVCSLLFVAAAWGAVVGVLLLSFLLRVAVAL